MSVDVFQIYGPAGKLIERPGGVCPDWCATDHMPARYDDGVHSSDCLCVDLSSEQKEQHEFTNGAVPQVTVNVQDHPGSEPFVMLTHHDEMATSEDKLTVTEADKIAWALEKNASVIRANGDHTCWCDGLHGPRDLHYGEGEDISPSLMPVPPNPITVAVMRDWDDPAARVQVVSHTARMWDLLTPDEAERLAANLRRCAAILAVHQANTRLKELEQ